MNTLLPQQKLAGTIVGPVDAAVALPERPNIHELTVQGVIAHMQSHISESLSLGRLSDVAGFSPGTSTARRSFRLWACPRSALPFRFFQNASPDRAQTGQARRSGVADSVPRYAANV
jgi:hypothetical protein